LSLGKQHHLLELAAAHPDQIVDLSARVDRSGLQPFPSSVQEFVEFGTGRRGGGAGASLFGTLPGGRARHLEPPFADAELQFDMAGLVSCQPVAAHGVACLARVARNGAEQREGDGIQNRRLPGPGASGDEEDAVVVEGVEVGGFGVAERPESGDGDAVDLHPRSDWFS